MVTIDARGIYYMQLNKRIRQALRDGATEVHIKNVYGQRYIADAVCGNYRIMIEGIPGSDLAAYMDGPEIIVRGNAQDAVANAMSGGRIIICGDAADDLGFAMRGGEVLLQGNAGNRAGMQMKESSSHIPCIIVGGKTGDFLGEKMTGGKIVVLGLPDGRDPAGHYCGTGMQGGVIYVRGTLPAYRLAREAMVVTPGRDDLVFLEGVRKKYCAAFGLETRNPSTFTKIVPRI